MIRTIIIDDEEKNRECLKHLITDNFPDIKLIGEADGVSTGVQVIRDLHPDLILLDIRLRDGDAFDLLQELGTIAFKVIFITAHEEYALQAIKFSALDYLLKPVGLEELKAALSKVRERIFNDLKVQISSLKEHAPASRSKTIVLKTMYKIYLVETDRIMRCTSDGSYSRFFTDDGKQYIVSKPLKEYESLLGGYGFFRIHKSHIVNLSFIESFDKEGYLFLKDSTCLPVSKRKKNELLEKLSSL